MAPVKWAKSDAKKLLYKDIVDGVIDGMQPRMVYHLTRPEYLEYNEDNFCTNCRNLRKAIQKVQNKSISAQRAYDYDQAFPVSNRHGFQSHKSVEQALLREDVVEGTVEGKTPIQIRESRVEFQQLEMTPEQWRNHLWHEKRRFLRKQRWAEQHEIVQMITRQFDWQQAPPGSLISPHKSAMVGRSIVN
jgi:hypothetical protein